MRNPYFSQKVKSEQDLYEDIIIESLKIYGQDVYYLPRDLINEDRILGEDVPSRFNSSYKVEMYIENVEGFDGQGDLFTKFGVEIRDQATFIVARRRWASAIGKFETEIDNTRPREGDIIYLPLTNSMFQIMHVEHEQPFYQLSNLPTYKMRCELFEYNDEDFDTGVDVIDGIEKSFAYRYRLTLGSKTRATVSPTITDGVLSALTITDSGSNYDEDATISFSDPDLDSQQAFAIVSLNPDGSIATADVSQEGRFYSSATVTVVTPDSASEATITATVTNGEVTALTITDAGLNYPAVPQIIISAPNAPKSAFKAVAEANYDSDTLKISSTTIINPGKFYDSSGSITATVDTPQARDFTVGNTVTQVLSSGITMSGEVAYWSDDSNILTLVHVGADSDGTTQGYNNFVTGLQIRSGDTIKWLVDSANESQAENSNISNDDFDTTSDDLGFLDFSETNPFGDPQ